MSYKPPYEINSSILNRVAAIMKMIGKFSSMNNLSSQPLLRRKNQIKSIHSSLAIENNQLSESQVKDLINGKLVIGPQKDILEVQNAINVYENLQDINPYAQKDLLKYHKILMTSLVFDAGSYRKGQVGVFNDEKVIFMAPSADRVPALMNNLYDYLNHYDENILIKSCVFHYEFEFIHPFSDGNGRMGRLFQTCLLANEEELFYYLPVESIIKQKQKAYYDAISKSNKEGASTVFIEFMLDAIIETMNDTLKQSNIETGSLSIQAKKLLTVLEEGIPYTTIELMDRVGIKSRASFKKNYLDPLLQSSMIEMTIPEKPMSRNQRYIKKYIKLI
ncbi:Fic family protein [Peloplasma aerotolerans]|uniref:Fic family protein n=1 Tax=Peloplasma aerotolerans TaxID=3044389 RepID=A0AAW6U8A6_9MOLU|nr:Fic family protein [Mariniplasma sp. M4Ah]MDI6452879.1 Fic family protein [Mariniplasma sp. M4Ah]